MEIHTDWSEIMKDCGGAKSNDNDLLQVSRGALKLALSALSAQNDAEYYHNCGAAALEISSVLGETNK